jgi:hypothetical protein
MVYLLSCLTANALGPDIINDGGKCYAGFKISWTWMANDITADPYLDRYAEGFYRASNEFPNSVTQNYLWWQCRDRSIAEYNRWINIWETERSDDPGAADAIKWLIHDRDGLVCLGDMDSQIAATGEPTQLTIITIPPENIHVNEILHFTGQLSYSISGAPLVDKTIHFMVDGTSLLTVQTNSEGIWDIQSTLAPGSHFISALFLGDENYRPASTLKYPVNVAVSEMRVTIPPPKSSMIGKVVIFEGQLIDLASGVGIPGKTVNCVGDVITETVTNDLGVWHFDLIFGIEQLHTFKAAFAGDAEFGPSETIQYSVSTHPTPIFGNDLIGSSNRGSSADIYGSTFKAPEDGYAKSIVAGLAVASGIDLVRVGIYDFENKKLLAQSYETQITNKTVQWIRFPLTSVAKLTAGKTYILVFWGLNSNIYYSDNEFLGNSFANWAERSLPVNMPSFAGGYYKYSIFCEYTYEEENMSVIFSGEVSEQAVAGEIVTIKVTPQNGIPEEITTTTKTDRTYSVEYTNVPGSYTAQARVAEDALYLAAESAIYPFEITGDKLPRTIILNITR